MSQIQYEFELRLIKDREALLRLRIKTLEALLERAEEDINRWNFLHVSDLAKN